MQNSHGNVLRKIVLAQHTQETTWSPDLTEITTIHQHELTYMPRNSCSQSGKGHAKLLIHYQTCTTARSSNSETENGTTYTQSLTNAYSRWWRQQHQTTTHHSTQIMSFYQYWIFLSISLWHRYSGTVNQVMVATINVNNEKSWNKSKNKQWNKKSVK